MNLRKKENSRGHLSSVLLTRGRSGLAVMWEYLTQAGLAERVTRLGTHAALVMLILVFAWGLREFYVKAQVLVVSGESPPSATEALPAAGVDLPAFESAPAVDALPGSLSSRPAEAAFLQPRTGVLRQAQLHTDAPAGARDEIIRYVVQPGDTLLGIAGQFRLQPETILWANQQTLGDNPHSLRPEQELTILPVDGAYHRWSAGDNLDAVARFYNASPEAILNFPGNRLDAANIGDPANPGIAPGAWLVIPGGKRDFVSWSAPVIPLDNPGVAKVLGAGACETVSAGVVGAGLFVWPAESKFLGGFDYEPKANHPAIDIAGDEGAAVFAADSGVVVYSGWNEWGYGNVVVVNHGNGWQTLYAHLNALYVTCGQSVFQGDTIAAIGKTGNAIAPNLHFEMMYNGVKVNPHDYVK